MQLDRLDALLLGRLVRERERPDRVDRRAPGGELRAVRSRDRGDRVVVLVATVGRIRRDEDVRVQRDGGSEDLGVRTVAERLERVAVLRERRRVEEPLLRERGDVLQSLAPAVRGGVQRDLVAVEHERRRAGGPADRRVREGVHEVVDDGLRRRAAQRHLVGAPLPFGSPSLKARSTVRSSSVVVGCSSPSASSHVVFIQSFDG